MTDASKTPLTIRPLHAWDEYVACEELQAEVWQMPDYRESVPAALLKVSHQNGGILLGAFDTDDRLVAFVYGILGMEEHAGERILKHHSHMLAVKPEWRRSGIGVALKWAQRDEMLKQGIPFATWTFDPLQALNARLNLIRLGVLARRYLVNAYGEMNDALNAGMASDRFEVEWWVNSKRVRACVAGHRSREEWDDARLVFDVRENSRGWLQVRAARDIPSDRALVEIPDDIIALRRADLALAKDWRMKTRAVFIRAFEQGFVATGVALTQRGGERIRVAYVLTRPQAFTE